MKTKIVTYLAILLSLITFDGMWLGLFATEDYQQAMGHIMREKVIVWPWIAFYFFYPLAIFSLVIKVQLPTESRYQFLWRGLVLGATVYGTYNLTNYALLLDWPLAISIKDWLWGSVLTSLCAGVGGQVWFKNMCVGSR